MYHFIFYALASAVFQQLELKKKLVQTVNTTTERHSVILKAVGLGITRGIQRLKHFLPWVRVDGASLLMQVDLTQTQLEPVLKR